MAGDEQIREFRGLPMSDLIGGPLLAASDAQMSLAIATERFVKTVGFVPKDDPSGKFDAGDPYGAVRTATFKFSRPVLGAERDAKTGSMPEETVELEVPLLAIVKIPALNIVNVDLAFEIEVKSSKSSKETDGANEMLAAEARLGWGRRAPVRISGSVASAGERARSTDSSAKFHVKVHASGTDIPEGLARVLDRINALIAPKAVTAPAKPGAAED